MIIYSIIRTSAGINHENELYVIQMNKQLLWKWKWKCDSSNLVFDLFCFLLCCVGLETIFIMFSQESKLECGSMFVSHPFKLMRLCDF